MFNKNDPLIESVKTVMQQSDAERAATEAVNEVFGIVDRKALPHELQPLWEEAYKAVLNEDVEALNELTAVMNKGVIRPRESSRHNAPILKAGAPGQKGDNASGVDPRIAPGTTSGIGNSKVTQTGSNSSSVTRSTYKENVEALNELSRKKLAKYAGDAADDLADKTDPNYAYMADIDQDTLERETENRRRGIRRAVKKLAREDVERIVAEALKGNQHKIDANKNGRVDGHDFKLLRAGKKQMEEQSVLPKNLGPGSGQAGQHSVGNMTVRSQSPQEFMNKTKTYQGMSDATRPKLNTDVKTAPAAAVTRSANASDNVSDNKPAGHSKLQAQAIARKGFGSPAGGNYKSAQALPRNPANFPGDANGTKPARPPTNFPAKTDGPVGNAMRRAGSYVPGAANKNNDDLKMPAAADKVKLQGGKVVPGNTPKDTGGDLARDAAKNATPAKVDQDLTKNQSWSQKVGSAMRAHIAKGGKHGDTIDVDGKKIKVSWKDKQYQSNLTKKYSKSSAAKAKKV